MIPDQFPDPQVLQNHPVDAYFFQTGQGFDEQGQLGFLDQGVERHIELAAVLVAVGGHPFHFRQGEVFGLGSGGKGVQSAVNGIGAGLESGKKGVEAARRGEQFCLRGAACHRQKYLKTDLVVF